MLKNPQKLKNNTIDLIISTILFQPIVIKPGVNYRTKYTMIIIFAYFTLYYLLSLIAIKLTLINLLKNLSFSIIYPFLLFIITFLYKKVQRGPYHFNKYFLITVISNLLLPISHFLFIFNHLIAKIIGFSINLLISSIVCYNNMTFLSFWEGGNLLKGLLTILINGILINLCILIVTYFLKMR